MQRDGTLSGRSFVSQDTMSVYEPNREEAEAPSRSRLTQAEGDRLR